MHLTHNLNSLVFKTVDQIYTRIANLDRNYIDYVNRMYFLSYRYVINILASTESRRRQHCDVTGRELLNNHFLDLCDRNNFRVQSLCNTLSDILYQNNSLVQWHDIYIIRKCK